MELEASKKEKSGKIKRKYTDPSTDGLSTVVANSNCKKTVYVNGSKEFPPPTLESAWNEVGGDIESKTYALCGLTFEFALTKYWLVLGQGCDGIRGCHASATTSNTSPTRRAVRRTSSATTTRRCRRNSSTRTRKGSKKSTSSAMTAQRQMMPLS